MLPGGTIVWRITADSLLEGGVHVVGKAKRIVAAGMAAMFAPAIFMGAPAIGQSEPVPSDTARLFGARELVNQISLSPDGTKYAMIVARDGHGKSLAVGPVDMSDQPKAILRADGDPETLRSCSWANDTRLICGMYTTSGKGVQAIGFTRQLVINADGTGMKMLSANPDDNALALMQDGGSVIDWYGDEGGSAILATRRFVPSSGIGSNIDRSANGLGVERIDVGTLKRSTVEPPRYSASEYITDGLGSVRIMGLRAEDGNGVYKPGVAYSYRRVGTKGWEALSKVDGDGNGFNPYAVDPALNVAYGFDQLNGRQALFKVALDGSMKRDLVFARPDVDVDDVVRIGRKGRVVGVSFVTDRRQLTFFDPVLSKLQTSLGKAVPEFPLLYFVDSSADENRLLLWLGSDTTPGRYAVFDKKTRHLDMLLDARPNLAGIKLAKVQAVTYPAADGTQIPGYLTLPPDGAGKNVPAIVMPHGGPAARDEWGFDWLPQFFAARGYAVLQPNYRGSTGYGDQWFADNGFKSWRLAIGDVNDAGRWLVKQGIAAPDKLAIVGWSYGGYAALQSQVVDPDLFKAVVAIAPVTDLARLKSESYDFKEYALVQRQIGDGPHIAEGSPARHAELFKAPVLMFHGDRDQNVGIGESRLMLDKLKSAGKQVDLVEFKGLDHQLDDSDARARMLDRADRFLRANLHIAN